MTDRPRPRRSADDALQQRLADAVQASREDVRHPWYLYRTADGRVSDDDVAEVATVAMRRWRSSARRKGGRRDRVHDLGKGLWTHFAARFDHPNARDDFHFLGSVLAEILDEKP